MTTEMGSLLRSLWGNCFEVAVPFSISSSLEIFAAEFATAPAVNRDTFVVSHFAARYVGHFLNREETVALQASSFELLSSADYSRPRFFCPSIALSHANHSLTPRHTFAKSNHPVFFPHSRHSTGRTKTRIGV